LCINEDSEFKEIILNDLSFYAVEIRYPDDFYMPSVKEAKQAFNIANEVKDFVLKKLI